jgi:hypothetical protein
VLGPYMVHALKTKENSRMVTMERGYRMEAGLGGDNVGKKIELFGEQRTPMQDSTVCRRSPVSRFRWLATCSYHSPKDERRM